VVDLDTLAKLASVGAFVTSVVALAASVIGSQALRRTAARLDQIFAAPAASDTKLTKVARESASQTAVADEYVLASVRGVQKRLYQFAQYAFYGLGLLTLAGALLGGFVFMTINALNTSDVVPTGGDIPQEETRCPITVSRSPSPCSNYQRWTLASATEKIETTYHREDNQAGAGTTSFFLSSDGCDEQRVEIDWKLMAGLTVLNEGRESSATEDGAITRTDVPPGNKFRFIAERADNEACVATLVLTNFQFTKG